MALELTIQETPAVPARVRYNARGNVVVEAGRTLVLALLNPREALVKLVVPEGEQWRVQVNIIADVV